MPYLGPGVDNGYRSRFIYTATAGQTSFSGGDANGITLTYTDSEYLDVYQNGVLLVPGDDYAATTGTTVVLVQGASLNDKVEMIQYQAFGVADTVSRADGGAFGGNISTSGTLAVTGTSTLTGNITFSGDLIASTSGTSNFRAGVNAGDSIASGGNYNTVVGDEAGTAITTGDNNTAVGYNALTTDTQGSNSTAVGYQALTTQNFTSATDSHNTAVGYNAQASVTTGIQNVAIGSRCGDALTVGNQNVAVGADALSSDTKGDRNTAVGYNTLADQNFTSTTDSYNTGVGYNAGGAITTGVNNTIIGSLAGDAITDADNNTAVGYEALSTNTLGSASVAIGYRALKTQNYGSAQNGMNVAVGNNSGTSLTDGESCVFVGHGSGAAHTTGTHSIYIGRDAGYHSVSSTTGSRNLLIGSFTDGDAAGTSDMIVLGYNVTSTGANNLTFGSGTTDSNIAFGATSISAPSDIRLKEDIQDETVGLEFINELRPVTFRWKKEKDVPSDMKAYVADSEERVMNGKYNHGFIAQEVKAVIDKYDTKDGLGLWKEDGKDSRQRIAESELIPFLTKAIQELSAKNNALEARIKTLEDA